MCGPPSREASALPLEGNAEEEEEEHTHERIRTSYSQSKRIRIQLFSVNEDIDMKRTFVLTRDRCLEISVLPVPA